MRRAVALVGLVVATPAAAQEFSYAPPGELVPGSGQGRVDETVYMPGIRFPIEQAPAFANSQVWGRGGSQGPGGGQCDDENFSYPWHDNYCESRDWDMPLCPAGVGHQGQDIRASTCENRRWWAVAVADGTITGVGDYSVTLTTDDGSRPRYLHMDPASVQVSVGDRVRRGDRLGLVSNAFGGAATTIHLHFDIVQNVDGAGAVYVPGYMSLVRAYEDLLGQPAVPCAVIPAGGGVVDDEGPCFSKYGPAATWREADAGQGGHLWWTYAWVHDTPGNWARWHLELARAGRYRVSVAVDPTYSTSQQVTYGVRAGGRESTVTVDLTDGGPWLPLGEWAFAEGGDQWVSMYDNTGEDRALERRVAADAVRLEPVGVEPPPRDAAEPPPPPRDAGEEPPPPRDAGEEPPPPRDAGPRPPRNDAWVDPTPGDDGGEGPPPRDAEVEPAEDANDLVWRDAKVPGPVRPGTDATPWEAPDGAVDATEASHDGGCGVAPGRPSAGGGAVAALLALGAAARRRRRGRG